MILLLVSGIAPADLRTACTEKLGVAAGDVAADYDRDEEVGKAVTRLNDLYARALRSQDVRTSLAAQRELNRLLGLYQPAPDADGASDDSTARELAAVREHVAPLGLGKADSSTVELVRLAVAEILRLRRG